MITAIATYGGMEYHIRKYDTDEFTRARELFLNDWVNENIQWEWWELHGPECSVKYPAFTPDFIKRECYDHEFDYKIVKGVHIIDWYCCTGIHGSDEHIVTVYFV